MPCDPATDPSEFVKARLAYLEERRIGVWPRFDPGDETHEGVVTYVTNELIACNVTSEFVSGELRKRFGKDVRVESRRDFNIFELPEEADSLDLASRLRCADANVAPHPVFNLSQGIPRIGPGDDPQLVDADPDKPGAKLKGEYTVAVVDTGLLTPEPPLLATGSSIGPAGEDNPNLNASDDVVDWYGAAHGTFIGGILARRANGAALHFEKAVSNTGVLTLASVIDACDRAVERGIDVLNLSLGAYRAPGLSIPGLKDAVRRWIETTAKLGKELLIAAAAGNDSKSQPFYPAAFADHPRLGRHVMSVGALDTPDDRGERRPADFSNYGEWVKAWAPGVRLGSDYVTDLRFRYGDGSLQGFAGQAQWSGTSFATPYAAAEVIRYADEHPGMSPLRAWHEIRQGRPWVLFD